MHQKFIFVLGGRDLEMVTIRNLLEIHAPDSYVDKGLAWGANASVYSDEITAALEEGITPVLVELQLDIELDQNRIIVVDHHGARAGADKPTSLEQIFNLLGRPSSEWNRWLDLVSANDRGYISEMQAMGATTDEIIRVRAADRSAQGISPAEEEAGASAVADAIRLIGGMLVVVNLPHGRIATVSDRLHEGLGGPGYENLLIHSPGSEFFEGDGRIVEMLAKAYPGGYFGGALPDRGFWGYESKADGIETFICGRIIISLVSAEGHRNPDDSPLNQTAAG